MQTQTCKRRVPYCVPRQVCETRYVTRAKCVPRQVMVRKTRCVPRVVCRQVPCEPGCPAPGCPTPPCAAPMECVPPVCAGPEGVHGG
jgi:hypothetical protein